MPRTMIFNIPLTTQKEIANPAAPGFRHEQMKQIACSLAAQNLAAPAITARLRSMYDESMSEDGKSAAIVDWADCAGL